MKDCKDVAAANAKWTMALIADLLVRDSADIARKSLIKASLFSRSIMGTVSCRCIVNDFGRSD